MIMTNDTPNIGDTRIKSGFLFLPMSIYGTGYETIKWLQFAKWEETYTESKISGLYWKTTKFL